MASVSVHNLAKRYPVDSKYCTLADVSFSVDDGEYFCLVGPSESGKTSTLRLIAGIDEPNEGHVEFDDEPMGGIPTNERNVSFVFENLALYPNKTGRQNIENPLDVAGIPEEERTDRVEEIAERLGISHLLDRKPETFSGGEKQRVGIARALVGESTIYLLDEPLGGLDAKLKQELRVLLKEIHEDMGGTFIHVTHSQEEAMSVADRMAVMKDGRVHQIGTPTELYDDPVDEFVASFIGNPTINYLSGSVADGNLTVDEFEFDTRALGTELSDGTYTVGIRPQDIRLVRDGETNGYTATVEITEPLGSETIVDVSIGEQELRVVSDERWVQQELGIGDAVGLEVTEADLYVVETETGSVVRTPTRDQ